MTENNQSVRFAGYKWAWFAGKDVADQNMKAFSESVDWDLVRSYASSLRDGSKCVIDPAVALGGRHLVRIIRFEDGPQWIARLRTTSSADDDALLKREVDCLELVKARTSVPVPKVFGHQSTAQSKIGAPLMLMECIPGNVGMDLNFDFIPSEHKSSFFEAMARCQVQISSLLFPKIGSIKRLDDGTFEVGPLPELGGPFETATEYLQAWADNISYRHSEEFVKKITRGRMPDDRLDELVASIFEFPAKVKQLAGKLCRRDRGPFPLRHVDFGHNNIIVDDEYQVLAVIDWEHAFAAPWETVEFPTTVWEVPAPLDDTPEDFDEHGVPKDEKARITQADRKDYLEAVRRAEEHYALPPTLSEVLGDVSMQDLANGLRLYEGGKVGFYSKILDGYTT